MSRTSRDLQLLSLLRTAASDRTDLELAAFSSHQIEWAIATGLGPLLFRCTGNDPERTANRHFAALHSSELTARILSGETLDAATEILAACEPRGPVITLLKGLSTCDQYYPEPHLRPMGDIDLLVDRERAGEVEAVLTALGYERKSNYPAAFYANHHHTCPFFRASTEDWVEIHVGLFPPQSWPGRDAVFAPASVAAEMRTSTFRQFEVHRLSAELQVVYLATHWGFELEVIGAMVPMVDLLLLLEQTPELDWERILGWLEGTTAAAYLYLLLAFLDRHDLLTLDARVLASLRALQRPVGPLSMPLASNLLERYVVEGRAFGPLLTERNFAVTWSTLLQPGSPLGNLGRLPWRLIPDRFRFGRPSG